MATHSNKQVDVEKIVRLIEDFRQAMDWDARFHGQGHSRSIFHNAAARLAMSNLALRIPGARLQKVHMVAGGMSKGVREFIVQVPGSDCVLSINGQQTQHEIENAMALRIFADSHYDAGSCKITITEEKDVHEVLRSVPFVEHKVALMQVEFDRLWLNLETGASQAIGFKRRTI